MKKLRYVNPGDKISASDYNELVREVERLSRLRAAPPLELVDDSAGLTLRTNEYGFWAKLTSVDYCALPRIRYGWQEVYPTGLGTFGAMDFLGRSGTPGGPGSAFEVSNTNIDLTSNGPVVWLTPGRHGTYLFKYCCEGLSSCDSEPPPCCFPIYEYSDESSSSSSVSSSCHCRCPDGNDFEEIFVTFSAIPCHTPFGSSSSSSSTVACCCGLEGLTVVLVWDGFNWFGSATPAGCTEGTVVINVYCGDDDCSMFIDVSGTTLELDILSCVPLYATATGLEDLFTQCTTVGVTVTR